MLSQDQCLGTTLVIVSMYVHSMFGERKRVGVNGVAKKVGGCRPKEVTVNMEKGVKLGNLKKRAADNKKTN